VTGPSPLVAADRVSAVFRSGGFLTRRPAVRAVTEATLSLARGEVLGVVGESGSGKSTLGRLLLGLLPPAAGMVSFDGDAMPAPGTAGWRALRRRMQIVFQDPYGSLDPRRRIGAQIGDGIALHRPAADRAAEMRRLLGLVGLDPSHAERFPHEFSGGQRQRIGIARALAPGPEFIVADEPVSSLDVSIQAQIVALLARLRSELGLAMLFISHDLPVVRHLADRVIVMYLGRIVEEGPANALFRRPAHPYTRALVSAAPRRKAGGPARIVLPGEPPSPSNPPSGCVFSTRCAHAVAACADRVPAMRAVSAGHGAACHRLAEIG
jgi:peptide/nickel transport system ATP-binding protein